MEVESISQHTSRRFNKDLEGIHNLVLNMGGLVEDQFDRAIRAIAEADSELGLSVAESDHQVNDMEVRIDDECRRVLATRAPDGGRPAPHRCRHEDDHGTGANRRRGGKDR